MVLGAPPTVTVILMVTTTPLTRSPREQVTAEERADLAQVPRLEVAEV